MPNRFALLAAAALLLTAHAAHAQRPVITQNIDEPGRSPYRATRFELCNAGFILTRFDPVPAGKRLVVTFMSGLVPVSPTSTLYAGLQGFTGPVSSPPVFVSMTLAGRNDVAIISSPVVAYFEAGETPVAFSGCGGNVATTLTLEGHFISLP